MRIAAASGIATEMANGQLPVAEYDWVVDATGSPDGLRQAVAMARPRGTVILNPPCTARRRGYRAYHRQ